MKNENPLNSIFIKDSNGKITEEIDSIKNIHKFFDFLIDNKINNESKIKILDEFKTKLHNNRFISEFFSSYKNKSIYFYLFDLYLNKNANDKIKNSIQSLIEELCINIQTDKNIYEFLFQNMAKIFRGEMPTSSLSDYLKLLNVILSENENMLNPKNYFACAGNCKFVLDLKNDAIEIGNSFSINITFKTSVNKSNNNIKKESNLIKIYFSNKKELSIDLKYPSSLIIKNIKNESIKILEYLDWINLNITLAILNNKINLFVNVNGENTPNLFNLNNLSIKYDDNIEKIEFFNNFCGEVRSIYMFSQKESGPPASNSAEYLSKLKDYKQGLWKKKLLENFLKDIYQIYSVDVKSKSVYFKSSILGSKGDNKKSLYDNLVFLFTPINYIKTNIDKIEDALGKYTLQMIGNIKNHLFQKYQKKLMYVSDINNILPIMEMFLIYPESLTEQNLELFLQIISNILNFRKQNLKNIKDCKIFNILSMFIEKFPQKIFTHKILNAFFQLGKILFSNNYEAICSNYFKHILLNEKILSKYDNTLQIEFWDQLLLFCKSDITQIETFININRLCLILRFYDRNKYSEICCEEHLNEIKPEYVGSKKVMNPNMLQKLSNLKNIMDLIIGSQDPKNAISLFKLLTLDLSPCLVKFILNIFIHALKSKSNDDNEVNNQKEKNDKKNKKDKKSKNENNIQNDKIDEKEQWKEKFVEQLLQSKYEVIIVNTFIHSLPDVRIELLKFVYQVHLRLILTKNTNNFNIFEKMIKTCLLPGKMFYYTKSSNNIFQKVNNTNNFTNPKIESKKEFPKNPETKKEEFKKPDLKVEEIKKPEQKKEEIKKLEAKKEEFKKPEPKKELPKKLQINKMFEPKKEDNTRLMTTPGGGRQNFLALLSKFDNPSSNNQNNDFKKSVYIKQPNKKEKENPFLNAPLKPTNQNEMKKTPLIQVKEEILKEQKKNLLKIKEEKPLTEAKIERKNALLSSTNSSAPNKINTNLTKPNTSNNTLISEKNMNNSTSSINSKIPQKNISYNNYYGQTNTDGGEIIIKDSEMIKYIKKLYSVFMLWTITEDLDSIFEKIDLDKKNIKVINTIEIIFLLNNMIKNKELILEFLKNIKKLVNKPENCFEIFFNKKAYSSFLEITFDNYTKKGKDDIEIYNLGKNILVSLFINSLIFCEKQPNLNPGNEIETILLWGIKVLQENNSKDKEHLLFEFIHELFYEFLIEYKIKFEVDMKLDKKDFNIEKNYYLKNYLMFMTVIFIFILRFKQDPEIHKNGTSFLFYTGKKIFVPALLTSMRMSQDSCNEIARDWLDFTLIHDIFNRYKYIWVKNNIYKKLDVDKYKNNKSDKYDYVIENIVLSKEKNIFQKELILLCFEDKRADFEYIIPLIKIILQTLMFMLEFLKNTKNEKDFLAWLKDLKGFIRFIIIASCNLTKHNQTDFYKNIQDKCLEPICAGLIFMQNLCLLSSICKTKIEKSLNSLLLLCLKLIKYQFNNENKHNKLFKLVKKEKSDIGNSAIIQLFNDFIKDKSGNPFLNSSKIESFPLDDNKNCLSSINSLRISDEFVNAFWDNPNLKNKLYNGFYSLQSYKRSVDYKYDLFPCLLETFDDSYQKSILTLLPKYETELAKYSNNSIAKNIKNKNLYKAIKKKAFSWRGYWSSRELFFTENQQFKYKLINHFTKSFMKPILVPILDISYYLPEFSGFDTKNLFRIEKNNEKKKNYVINLDIDKVLKIHDQNTQDNSKEKKESNKDNYLGNIYKKSNKILYEKYLKIANNLEFGKEEEFSYIEREESYKNNISKEDQKMKKYYLCCLVKTSHHIKGVCFIDDNKLNFKVFLNQKTGSAMSGVEVGFTTNDDDYDQERKTCFGSYFICHPKDKDLYNISINYNNIKWIFRRKYYYTDSAFEIYTTTNKAFYFNLKYEKEREVVIDEILKKMGDYAQIVDDLKENSSKENIVGYENSIVQKKKKDKIKLSKILKLWKNWEITNFEFLMWLNIFGNRSYNDISQYPVFPWILSNYEDPLQQEKSKNEKDGDMDLLSNKIISNEENNYGLDYQYRDMNLPMGMMELNDEGKKRKELFLEIYESLKEEPDPNMKPYIFGSNYSNPVYVCNYLMRLFPFTHISIELQGHKFDDPNRLFISVKNSFYNSTTQKTDLRELIPEFFYLPEIFRNINKLNMGKLETGEEVNDVKTPCNNNPYDFIMTMKSVLESNKLSKTIQNWIDLIFGYKSRGKDAENAKNIFSQASYQENIDINKVENKESYLRMVEFGLIPSQIMSKECSKREKKESIRKGKEITNSTCDLKCYNFKINNENDNIKKEKKNIAVLEMVSFSSEKILLLLNNNKIIEKKINFSTSSYEDSNLFTLYNYFNKMKDFYNPKISNNKVFKFLQKGKVLIMGGFYDGKVQIVSIDQKTETVHLVPFTDKLPVISICVDKDEEFAFFGNTIGNVRILKLDKEPKNYKLFNTITDHTSEISHIDCNSELNLWASASIDGYINIYTSPLSKLIRSLKIPATKCDYIFLSASPLPSIVVITQEKIKEKNEEKIISEIFIYSINGKFLLRQKEPELLSCPKIINDLNNNDYLAYILSETIIIRSIPTLIRQTCTDPIPNIYSFYQSEDIKHLYGINKTGNEIFVIKDKSKN